jgi:2-methylaconitate cis-trans-isomerase PrpF
MGARLTTATGADAGSGHRAIESVVMRGGTSRGPVLLARSLPSDPAERDCFVVRLVGGGAVQTDGLGGGNPTTSKVVVVNPTANKQDGVEFDYAVGNVVVGYNAVDWSGTCGNMTATVPVFALEEGFIQRSRDERMRLRNLSTGGLVDAFIQGASAHKRGDEITVRTAFLNPGGSVFKSVLPTGVPCERLLVDGHAYSASIVDVTHPYLFLRYDEVVGQNDISDPAIVSFIEKIRGAACVRLGLTKTAEEAMASSPAIPRVVLLHTTPRDQQEIRITAVSMGRLIASVPVTASMCIAAARQMKDTLVAKINHEQANDGTLQVAGPAARLTAAAELDADGGIISTAVDRTVRSIMRGTAWV